MWLGVPVPFDLTIQGREAKSSHGVYRTIDEANFPSARDILCYFCVQIIMNRDAKDALMDNMLQNITEKELPHLMDAIDPATIFRGQNTPKIDALQPQEKHL